MLNTQQQRDFLTEVEQKQILLFCFIVFTFETGDLFKNVITR